MNLIEAAINGSRTRSEHGAVPITPQELASAAEESARAGANAIHFHIRSESGTETLGSSDLAL